MRYNVVALLLLLMPAVAVAASVDALFSAHQRSIYQIRVIDVVSGDKAAIGSGFTISADGRIATNYHVISKAVLSPQRYRLEYRDSEGAEGLLSIQAIDVIHDLALVRREGALLPYFKLSSRPPSQGHRMFAMGNPFDLGMSIIEGNFNGYLKHAMFEKVLFSGALNQGMSGGPAFNARGDVVGINVSTMGNDISFLVPVKFLRQLQAEQRVGQSAEARDFNAVISEQLMQHQRQRLASMQASTWHLAVFGDEILVPEKISKFIKCWGDSPKAANKRYRQTYRICSTEDEIYLAPDFRTGKIKYRYSLLQGKDLNTYQFHSLYQQSYQNMVPMLGVANEENVTPYQCNGAILNIKNSLWKSTFCSRKYKKHPQLHDMMLLMARLAQDDRGILLSMGLSGVEKQAGMALLQQFSESFEWQR